MKITAPTRRGGFTLVELLIVIIIIAILAGMMMMSTGSATDRAEATKIVSDLRSMKSAALMYYVDYKEWPFSGVASGGGWDKSIEKYMDRSLDKRYEALWFRANNPEHEKIYIGVKISEFAPRVQKILQEMRDDVGLYGTTTATAAMPFTFPTNKHVYMVLK